MSDVGKHTCNYVESGRVTNSDMSVTITSRCSICQDTRIETMPGK